MPSPSPDPIDAAAPSDAAVPPAPAAECLAAVFVQGMPVEDFDYDQYGPAIGSHCRGTNHQDIDGVERVVFLGDSVTVGTPPVDKLAAIVAHVAEQFMALAVETGADMVFLLEHFCGHGYNRGNPDSPCYDGVESELWFDVSCTHPTAEGHAEIFGLFRNIVEE